MGDRTLEELDGGSWGEPTFESYVVRTCHALRRKPLKSLTDEEMRLAVGQGIGLEWLVPLMLQRLAEDPFRAGDFFEGDLLASLARVPSSYWTEHPAEKTVLATEIMTAALSDSRLPDMTKETQQAIADLRAASE
ncbi:MAG TPA: contact-dependent growth inhibition system immunity protein [Xanthobacteraceae bacterium]|nr:contact-dependent growth inhibition system immunity protein [Xanthobacteraceae bacterium]